MATEKSQSTSERPFIPLLYSMAPRPPRAIGLACGYELFQDSLHPNERGHELIADALLEAFREHAELPPR